MGSKDGLDSSERGLVNQDREVEGTKISLINYSSSWAEAWVEVGH